MRQNRTSSSHTRDERDDKRAGWTRRHYLHIDSRDRDSHDRLPSEYTVPLPEPLGGLASVRLVSSDVALSAPVSRGAVASCWLVEHDHCLEHHETVRVAWRRSRTPEETELLRRLSVPADVCPLKSCELVVALPPTLHDVVGFGASTRAHALGLPWVLSLANPHHLPGPCCQGVRVTVLHHQSLPSPSIFDVVGVASSRQLLVVPTNHATVRHLASEAAAAAAGGASHSSDRDAAEDGRHAQRSIAVASLRFEQTPSKFAELLQAGFAEVQTVFEREQSRREAGFRAFVAAVRRAADRLRHPASYSDSDDEDDKDEGDGTWRGTARAAVRRLLLAPDDGGGGRARGDQRDAALLDAAEADCLRALEPSWSLWETSRRLEVEVRAVWEPSSSGPRGADGAFRLRWSVRPSHEQATVCSLQVPVAWRPRGADPSAAVLMAGEAAAAAVVQYTPVPNAQTHRWPLRGSTLADCVASVASRSPAGLAVQADMVVQCRAEDGSVSKWEVPAGIYALDELRTRFFDSADCPYNVAAVVQGDSGPRRPLLLRFSHRHGQRFTLAVTEHRVDGRDHVPAGWSSAADRVPSESADLVCGQGDPPGAAVPHPEDRDPAHAWPRQAYSLVVQSGRRGGRVRLSGLPQSVQLVAAEDEPRRGRAWVTTCPHRMRRGALFRYACAATGHREPPVFGSAIVLESLDPFSFVASIPPSRLACSVLADPCAFHIEERGRCTGVATPPEFELSLDDHLAAAEGGAAPPRVWLDVYAEPGRRHLGASHSWSNRRDGTSHSLGLSVAAAGATAHYPASESSHCIALDHTLDEPCRGLRLLLSVEPPADLVVGEHRLVLELVATGSGSRSLAAPLRS